LVRSGCTVLNTTTADGNLGENFFFDLLRRGFSEEGARGQLRIAVAGAVMANSSISPPNTRPLTLDQAVDARTA
jgi:hypothetical protein